MLVLVRSKRPGHIPELALIFFFIAVMFDAFEKLIHSRNWVGKALELAVDCSSFFFKFILVQTRKQFEIVPARGWALAIFGPVEVTELPLELVALALFFFFEMFAASPLPRQGGA